MKANIAVGLLRLSNFSDLLLILKTSMKNLKKRAKVIGLFLMKNFKKLFPFPKIDFRGIKHF